MLYLPTDPFLNKQPEKSFVAELLRPVHEDITPFPPKAPQESEVFFTSLALSLDFPDPEGLLTTAYADFRDFLSRAGIGEAADGLPLTLCHAETPCREAYRILISRQEIRLLAADTEGIRRALIYLEDEMLRRRGGLLPLGEIARTPVIRTRISRCFFTPPSGASNEETVSELASDIDYYPEEYLLRLAHDGINALWLGASFRSLLKSDIIPEYGKDSERRMRKLCEVVEKCRRFGIGIYLFALEPASGNYNPALEAHPELCGAPIAGGQAHLFCPSTEGCRAYIKEAVTRLFTAVPHLAGILDLTTGEYLSGCGSAMRLECPRCRETFGSLGATLAATEKMIADAVNEVAPEAEFISWTYSQRTWQAADREEACRLRDRKVIHMQNFEELGKTIQLGRERLALDYWLSYVGPGELFTESLAINKSRGVRTFAKLQVCSSHEISSVPYIPVPGILYDKYRYLHENGVTGVVQCWYFGNYPSLMNKAATELSFAPFFRTKREFLLHLAGIYWGSDHAAACADAWEHFEAGYREFPVSLSFEWFGPMQDATAAPLHLLPADLPMPSTWLLRDMVGGDRIGECLSSGHTIEEAVTLSERMCRGFDEGNALLSRLPDGGLYSRREQKSVAAAIGILFTSGHRMLRFYELRRLLAIGKGDADAHLAEMEAIVRAELTATDALTALSRADTRLGYHSEANGYKFFPEKLTWRREELSRLLREEFPVVRARLAEGKRPLGYYYGEHPEARIVPIGGAPLAFLGKDGSPTDTTISATEEAGIVTLTLRFQKPEQDRFELRPEFRMFFPTPPFSLGGGHVHVGGDKYLSLFGDRIENRRAAITATFAVEDGWGVYRLSLCRRLLGMEEGEPFRLAITRIDTGEVLSPATGEVYRRLLHGVVAPRSYAFIL